MGVGPIRERMDVFNAWETAWYVDVHDYNNEKHNMLMFMTTTTTQNLHYNQGKLIHILIPITKLN